MNKDIRVPQQKRSIEKKERIITVAYQLFNEKGYFGTNTVDIAVAANISTGSVYAYFKDKKDILLICLKRYGIEVQQMICDKLVTINLNNDIQEIIKEVIFAFMESHRLSQKFHDEIASLRYLDEDVKKFFVREEAVLMTVIVEQLKKKGITFLYEREQSMLFYLFIDSMEGELIYNKNSSINKDIMINECSRLIVSMMTFKSSTLPTSAQKSF